MAASELIDKQIADLPDWRGQLLAKLRQLIHEADPEIVEDWKWSTAVWTHNGLVCAGGAFKDHLKLNFFQGASLEDPHHLFNAGLDAKRTRAIDFYEGNAVNQAALQELIRTAVAHNIAGR
ncbi:MAG: hypothetical protein QOF51_4114 [Chloroflexota bacterium]|jgi:hypothetical protein|nr:hypothetical protein [Chloroflexota bacterium]